MANPLEQLEELEQAEQPAVFKRPAGDDPNPKPKPKAAPKAKGKPTKAKAKTKTKAKAEVKPQAKAKRPASQSPGPQSEEEAKPELSDATDAITTARDRVKARKLGEMWDVLPAFVKAHGLGCCWVFLWLLASSVVVWWLSEKEQECKSKSREREPQREQACWLLPLSSPSPSL
jgi:hypothetical protein